MDVNKEIIEAILFDYLRTSRGYDIDYRVGEVVVWKTGDDMKQFHIFGSLAEAIAYILNKPEVKNVRR